MSKIEPSTEYQLNQPISYTLRIDDDLLKATNQKLQLARFPEELVEVADDDWNQGAKVKAVQELAGYWRDKYDWRAEEVYLILLLECFRG